jgi:DNA-binding MarR family transcriptional regulator
LSGDLIILERRPLAPLLHEVKRVMVDELHERLTRDGYPEVRPGHGCVFGFLDRDAGSRLTELAEAARMTKQAVGEAVADLEGKGYVERVPDPLDGRAKIIRLTERGHSGVEAADRHFADIEREWAGRIGEERMAALREALELLAAPAYAGTDSRM